MKVIIAPHADDGLIGCSRVLEKGVDIIVYVEKLNKVREKEVEKMFKHFKVGMIIKTISVDELVYQLELLKKGDSVYVPSTDERHWLHKSVGGLARLVWEKSNRKFNLYYYSTDMSEHWVVELSKEEQKKKRKLLNMIYPSQKSLWNNEHKYFLFEGVIRIGGGK